MRVIIAFLILLGLSSQTFAEAPKLLAKSKLLSREARVQHLGAQRSEALAKLYLSKLGEARRFRVITPDGRSVFARKRRSTGKARELPLHGTKLLSVSYHGDIRIPGTRRLGSFHLSLVSEGNKKSIAASFVMPKSRVSVHHASDGAVVREYAPESFPPCAGLPAPAGDQLDSNGGSGGGQQSPPASMDGAVLIDIAVLLSPEVVVAYGGASGAAAEAVTAVASANEAYINSGISQELRLVYVGETATSQSSSISTDLTRLQLSGDGYFDEAQSVRTEYGPDLISLFTHYTGGNSCGIAYLMQTVDADFFRSYAFSVVMDACATLNHSFAHELGHNMGAAHNIEDSGGPGAYAYSYGWRFAGTDLQNYRTIMAYDSGTPGETRINYFSNPNVNYQGTASGTSSADNALTLNNTASTVASLYNSEVPTATPTSAPGEEATPTPEPTPEPTATPEGGIPQFQGLRSKAVGRNCAISGYLKNGEGKSLKKKSVKLLRASRSRLSTTKTGRRGDFSFRANRRKTYLVTYGLSLESEIRCR